jgi:glucose dehydrogenase
LSTPFAAGNRFAVPIREATMNTGSRVLAWTNITLAAGAGCAALAIGVCGSRAADVTYQRLVNPEPQNWLMNHHDFSARRFSALDAINTSNVRNLRLAFAVALGGTTGNENLTATPLVDDGFMYVPDAWGAVYKIDVRSGKSGDIVWKMDPGQEKIDRNRGVALWGNLVISVTSSDGRVIATDRDTGKMVWERNLRDQPNLTLNAAPATRRRNTTPPTVPATTSSPTARWRSMRRTEKSSGSTNTPRTTRWIMTRPAPTSCSTPTSTARTARSFPMPAATASSIRSTGSTASFSRRPNTCPP